jgi:hypothetical protein
LLKAFLKISKDVVAEAGSGDELSRKIYASYQQFRASIMDWSDIAERAFLNSRRNLFSIWPKISSECLSASAPSQMAGLNDRSAAQAASSNCSSVRPRLRSGFRQLKSARPTTAASPAGGKPEFRREERGEGAAAS